MERQPAGLIIISYSPVNTISLKDWSNLLSKLTGHQHTHQREACVLQIPAGSPTLKDVSSLAPPPRMTSDKDSTVKTGVW